MKMNARMKKCLSILLCAVLLVQNFPVMAFAATEDNLCEHHTAHSTEVCGYVAAVPEVKCTHEHTAQCQEVTTACTHTHGQDGCTYVPGKDAVYCGHACSTDVCGYVAPSEGTSCDCVPGEDGTVIHTEGCGYVAPSEGTPCGFVHEGCGCAAAVEATGECGHVCSAESGCEKTVYTCGHAEDGSCCYVAAVVGHPCHFECADCAAAAEATTEPSTEAPTETTPVCICEASCGGENGINFACPVCAEDFGLCAHYVPTCDCAGKCTEGAVNSACPVCAADASACTGKEVAAPYVTMTGGEKLYLKPNSNWKVDNARFAAYFFGTSNKWVSMTAVEGETDIYVVTVPSGSWTNVIFCRMNPSISDNNWYANTKWNQTGDLVYDGTNNMFTLPNDAWDGSTTGWGKFVATKRSVTINEGIVNGAVESDKATAAMNDTVTLTVTPDEGYEVDTVSYNNTPIIPVDGEYSFQMPASDVIVTATFKEIVISYNLWVSENIAVTSKNAGDVLGDGKVAYDPSTNTLSLSGANITKATPKDTGDHPCAILYKGTTPLTISISGNNTINTINNGVDPAGGAGSYGIYSEADLTLTGDGYLYVQGSTAIGTAGDLYIGTGFDQNNQTLKLHLVAETVIGSVLAVDSVSFPKSTYEYDKDDGWYTLYYDWRTSATGAFEDETSPDYSKNYLEIVGGNNHTWEYTDNGDENHKVTCKCGALYFSATPHDQFSNVCSCGAVFAHLDADTSVSGEEAKYRDLSEALKAAADMSGQQTVEISSMSLTKDATLNAEDWLEIGSTFSNCTLTVDGATLTLENGSGINIWKNVITCINGGKVIDKGAYFYGTNNSGSTHTHTDWAYVDNGDGTHSRVCECSACNLTYHDGSDPAVHSCSSATGKCVCGLECTHSWNENTCNICGMVCKHSDINADTGKCTLCQTQIVAEVENAGGAVRHTDFDAALTAWCSRDDQTLTLWDNVTAASTIQVNTTGLVLELNGKTLTGKLSVGQSFDPISEGGLTVQDSTGDGKIIGELRVNCGSAEMTGGWIDNSNNDSGVYVSNDTTFTITGGKVTGRFAILNLGKVNISGNVTLEGKDYNEQNPGFGLYNEGTAIISGTPTIQGDTIDICAEAPITFQYVPTTALRVKMYNSGLFAKADGVTLTKDMFISMVDGKLVAEMEGGIGLVECDHQGVEADWQYLSKDNHTNTYSCCNLTKYVEHTMKDGVCTACGGRDIYFDIDYCDAVYLEYGENDYESLECIDGDNGIWTVIAPADAGSVYFTISLSPGSSHKTVSTEIPAGKNCFRVTNYDSETDSYNGVWYSYPCTNHTFAEDGYCTACGAACDHASVAEGGKCESCGLQHAVQVTVGGDTAYCVDFDKTVTYINGLEGSDAVHVTLLYNTSGGYNTTIPARTVVLDLNGKTLHVGGLRYASGADVTLRGTNGGELVVGSHYVSDGAKLTLESGTIRTADGSRSDAVIVKGTFVMTGGAVSASYNSGINVQDETSVVQVKGGTVSSVSDYALANVDPYSQIALSGGTFVGGIRNYSDNYGFKIVLRKMIAEGYKLVDENGDDVDMDNAETEETVTVVCSHSKSTHENATDLGNGKHSFTCTVCDGTGTESHSGGTEQTCKGYQCAKCGCWYGEKKADAHSGTLGTPVPTQDGTKHVASYDCCGAEVTGDHTFDSTTGKCACNAQAAAKVGETCYLTFSEALSHWTNGTTLTLLADQTGLRDKIVVTGADLVLDLNGHTLSSIFASQTIQVGENLGATDKLTIRDSGENGTVSGYDRALYALGTIVLERGTIKGAVSVNGTFEMTGGTVEGSDGLGVSMNYSAAKVVLSGGEVSGAYGVYAWDGDLTVTGTVKITGTEYYAVASRGNVTISGTPTLSGGSWGEIYVYPMGSEISPVTFLTQPAEGTWSVAMEVPGTFAVPGENFQLDADKFTAKEAGYVVKKLDDGSLALVSCDHRDSDHKNAADLGNGQHSFSCTVCKAEVSEDHTPTYALNDAGDTITVSCAANCGYTGTAAISAESKTYDGEPVAVTVTKTGSLENADAPVTFTKDGAAFTGELVNAGSYTASITCGDKTASVDVTISPRALTGDDVTVTLSPEEFLYDGNAHTPTVTVKLGEKTLVGGTYGEGFTPNNPTCDYRVVLPFDQTGLGTKAVTIVFMNNYSGDALAYYQIVIPEAKLSPATPNGENGWYTSAELVAPDRYRIASGADESAGTEIRLADGTEARSYWLIPAENSAAPAVELTLENIKVDGTKPTITKAQAADITDTTASILVAADDATSGVAGFVLTSADPNVVIGELTDGAFAVSGLTPNRVQALTLTVTDLAGNEASVNVDVKTDKAVAAVKAAPTAKELTYSGAAQALVAAGATNDGKLAYSLDGQTWSADIPTGTDAKEYTVWYMVVGDENHYDSGKASVKVTVAPASIADANISVTEKDMTYDGKEKSYDEILVSLGDLTLNDDDFTVSYTNNVNAGTATLTVTGVGNFNGSAEKSFTIGQRIAVIEAKDQTVTYGNAISGTAFTAYDLVDGHSAAVTLTPSTGNVTINGTITASGAKITAGDADMTANYQITYESGKLTIKPDTAAIEDLTTENVTSADEEAIKNVQDMLEKAESVHKDWEDIGDTCDELLERIEEVAAEQKKLTGDAAEFDDKTVKSTDKAELEKFAEDIEALLDSKNLTKEEQKALEDVLAQVEELMDVIDNTAAGIKEATDAVGALDMETVHYSDEDAIRDVIADIDELLASGNLTAEERAALTETKDDAEALLERIAASLDALRTEAVEKTLATTPENVQLAEKADILQAIETIENALKTYGGNYSESNKKELQDQIDTLKAALESITKAETVTDAISKLPATVEPDDEETAEKILAVKEAYDALTDHEKSLVDETARKGLETLLAALTDYDIVKGDGGKWTKGTDVELSFTANGTFSKFVCVEIDNKVLAEKHYTAKSGSTIINLKDSYLKTLSVGEHTITVVYTDGETSGTFKIRAESSNPATGDDSNIVFWTAATVVSIAALAAVLAESRKRRTAK